MRDCIILSVPANNIEGKRECYYNEIFNNRDDLIATLVFPGKFHFNMSKHTALLIQSPCMTNSV